MNLREQIGRLQELGELLTIDTELDARLEVACLTNLHAKRGGRALLCRQVKGTGLYLTTNLFGSERRMALALGSASLNEFSERLYADLQNVAGENSAVRLGRLVDVPMVQSRGDVSYEVLEDLDFLPQIRFWPDEERSFLTLAVVVTCAPDSAQRNFGVYRVGISGNRELTLNQLPGSGAAKHLAAWQRRNEKMPVAVLLGASPALLFAAAAGLPEGCPEDRFAAWLDTNTCRQVRSSVLPFDLPAAEILIEGQIEAGRTLNEGPFGCYLGDYGGGNDCPLIEIESIRCRPQAILPLTLAGPMPMENSWIAQARLALDRARLRIDLPQLVNVWQPLEAAYSGFYFVQSQTPPEELARRILELELLRPFSGLVRVDKEPGVDWRELLGDEKHDHWQKKTASFAYLHEQQPRLTYPAGLQESVLRRLSSSERDTFPAEGEQV